MVTFFWQQKKQHVPEILPRNIACAFEQCCINSLLRNSWVIQCSKMYTVEFQVKSSLPDHRGLTHVTLVLPQNPTLAHYPPSKFVLQAQFPTLKLAALAHHLSFALLVCLPEIRTNNYLPFVTTHFQSAAETEFISEQQFVVIFITRKTLIWPQQLSL